MVVGDLFGEVDSFLDAAVRLFGGGGVAAVPGGDIRAIGTPPRLAVPIADALVGQGVTAAEHMKAREIVGRVAGESADWTAGARKIVDDHLGIFRTARVILAPIAATPLGLSALAEIAQASVQGATRSINDGLAEAQRQVSRVPKLRLVSSRRRKSTRSRRRNRNAARRKKVVFESGVPGKDFAISIDSARYRMGGFSTEAIDCSGAVSAVVNSALGRDPFESRMSTVTERQWLAERGARAGRGGEGDLRISWYDYGGGANGHTAMTLPDGTNVESRGGDGMVVGSRASGAGHTMFNQHMYIPGELLRGGRVTAA